MDDRVNVQTIRSPEAMKHIATTLVIAGTLWLCAGLAVARATPQAPPSSAPAQPMSLEQAVKQVQHQTHGHILAADSVARGKNHVYRIKVLTPQGRVKVVQLHSNAQKKSTAAKQDSGQGGH